MKKFEPPFPLPLILKYTVLLFPGFQSFPSGWLTKTAWSVTMPLNIDFKDSIIPKNS